MSHLPPLFRTVINRQPLFVERLLRGRGDEIRIADSFKKMVNGSKKPWRNEEGFVIMGMKYRKEATI